MLDVHAPHEPIHGWRDFLIHLGTITIGLLIALGLEATAEWFHHRQEVADARESLHRELLANQEHFAINARNFRREAAVLKNNLLVLQFIQDHPKTPQGRLPGVLMWTISYARMEEAAWKMANQTEIAVYMPQEEVMRNDELYGFFDRADKAHEEEADALVDAISYGFHDPDPTHLSPAQLQNEIELTKNVLSRHLRVGFLLENVAEEFPDFKPAPSRVELEELLHLPDMGRNVDLNAPRRLTQQRIDAEAPLVTIAPAH